MTRRVVGAGAAIALLLATGLALALLLASERAAATFPGQNGLIAFSGLTEGPNGNDFCAAIYTATAKGRRLKKLTSGGCRDDYEDPSWSADGRRIAFTRDGRVFTMSRNGGDVRRVTRGAIFQGEEFEDLDPTWSPDGDRIAFWRSMGRRESTIYTIRPDGSDLQPLFETPSGLEESDPAYSPDGERIAFAGGPDERGSRGQPGVGFKDTLYTVRPDGTDLQMVTTGHRDVRDPDWAPDGGQIVFAAQDGGLDVFSIGSDGAGLVQLTTVEGGAFEPVYSPRGTKIALSRDGFLSLIPVGGGNPQRIVPLRKISVGDLSWESR